MDIIISYILEKSPGIVGMLIVGIIVWKIAAFYFGRFKKTEEKVNNLPCQTHEDKISKISTWVMQKDKTMIPPLSAKISPRRLTRVGTELLEISGGKRCIDENVDFFISEISRTNPMTPYDVEERALSTLQWNSDKSMFNHIKNYIYYSPEFVDLFGEKIEVSIFPIMYVMSLYLRDLYLEKHPELLPELETVEN